MLQQKKPIDLVISTGKQSTVKNFVNKVSKKLNMKIFGKVKEHLKKQLIKMEKL